MIVLHGLMSFNPSSQQSNPEQVYLIGYCIVHDVMAQTLGDPMPTRYHYFGKHQIRSF